MVLTYLDATDSPGKTSGATGTEVTVTATGVPPGISQADHEAGISSSLANLASHVEAVT